MIEKIIASSRLVKMTSTSVMGTPDHINKILMKKCHSKPYRKKSQVKKYIMMINGTVDVHLELYLF